MRGALAGVLAAAIWAGCDPLFKRAFRTDYADSELFGLGPHLAAGAAFGFVFERAGGRTVKQGVVAAVAENTLLWPAVELVKPGLARQRGAFASGTAGHALFGALLGLFLD